jgi:hypothetical protein
VNNSDLIFITVVVRHLFSPKRQDGFGFSGGTPQLFHDAITLAQRSSGVQHTRIGEVQFAGPALQA